ncbi:MAG: ABC transporter permease, partial [Proteobacteria bacterium]|nr:ABC transporter permease [Pseudomonadota bacterium]
AKAAQVAAQKKRLTGAGDDERLNQVMARFEELRFDLEFANERYRLALLALEGAQIEASRKVKSLVVVAHPNLPDEALYPDRLYIMATVAAFLLMGFAIFSVILAAIREHME